MPQEKKTFEEGYEYAVENLGAYVGGELSRQANQPYLNAIKKEIDNLTEAINSYQDNANPQLKGYVAEAWHTGTFNVDAAAKQSTVRAEQLQTNGLGSVDVSIGDKEYSLKYYQTGEKSALAQAHSLEFAYQRYIHKLGEGSEIPTREEYHKMNGFDPNTDMQLGMYEGQARLIPSDQIKDAIEALNKRIARDLNNLDNPNRAETAQRLIEVRDKLTTHLSGPNGEQSYELTEKESRILANQAKEGKFDPARYDITMAKKADLMLICSNAMKAGLNAAWISALLKMVPQLVTVIRKMVQEGYIDFDDLMDAGKAGISGAKSGFINGFLCAAVTSASQLGYFGNAIQSAANSPSFVPCIGVAIVLMYQALSDGIKCAKGELDEKQYAYNIERSLYIGAGGLAGGLILQAVATCVPVVAYAVGSMIGSLLGGFVFTAKECVMMSLCIKNGFTIFGLVDQDYTMPDEVREKLGFPIFGFKEYEFKEYEFKKYQPKTYEMKKYDWKRIDCVILKRGVIGFRKVGYVLSEA